MNSQTNQAEQVYKSFSGTKYGIKLARAARYDRFRPANYSVKYWERLLGQDVNNLHHMRESIIVTRWFIKNENAINPKTFSRRDAMLLTVTAALHDQAEAILGDIPYGRKSKRVRRMEAQVLRQHETVFAPRLGGLALKLYRIGRDEIAFSDVNTKLPGAFKTIELIGFMKNSFIALKRTDQLQTIVLSSKQASYLGIYDKAARERLITALKRLSAEVFGSGVVEGLIVKATDYPSAEKFLRQHAATITLGFQGVTDDVFDWYENGEDSGAKLGEKSDRAHKFSKQKACWYEYARP